jgi:hypothetical protein
LNLAHSIRSAFLLSCAMSAISLRLVIAVLPVDRAQSGLPVFPGG